MSVNVILISCAILGKNVIKFFNSSISCHLLLLKKMESLKAVLKNTLINGMLRHESRPQNAQGNFAWAVLVVDNVSMKILQACMQTYELTQENISCIENIEHQGRPFTNTHAIYFLSPVRFINAGFQIS